jgi:hypothetical protein
MEQLSDRLDPQAGKSPLIPKGEGIDTLPPLGEGLGMRDCNACCKLAKTRKPQKHQIRELEFVRDFSVSSVQSFG